MRNVAILLLALVPGLFGQGAEWVRANYTKYEYRIPMRDGKKLFTAVYAPKDNSKPYPILMTRTPYNVAPYGIDQYRANLGPSELFAKDFFIFVYQDVRGRYMSEGEFVNVTPVRGANGIDESTDTYDTIDWLIRNVPNHNGNVGIWGISYPGYYAATGMIGAHPALKAASPQAPIGDWFVGDDFHHNGALYLAHAFRFFSSFGHPRPEPTTAAGTQTKVESNDGYDFFLRAGPLSTINEKYFKNDVPFWNEMMRHGVYDEFWKSRDLRAHLKNIRPAVMTVGGWFDAEDLFGALNVYQSVEKGSPGSYNTLVMGPWYHGGWSGRSVGSSLGAVNFGSKTSEFYREKIEFPFFQHFLKGAPDPKLPDAYVFETGTNQWRRYDSWPPKNVSQKRLYLHARGKLSFDAPAGESGTFDEYVSDPAKPVPFIPGTSLTMTREHMVDDQRFAASRPDVLVYETEPLEEDITLAGPLRPSLFVSTSGTDSDFVVKLIDVYPENAPDPNPNPAGIHMGGYQQLVRGELMRGKFRKNYEKPEPFQPGKVEMIEYTMPDVYHAFRRGHRIMVHIQSSWFPLVDRNPQKFTDIYNARTEDFQKATERVYRAADQASSVLVNVLR